MVSTSETIGVEWTVSRCFRLLRPIISRKSTLLSEQPTEANRRAARSKISASETRRRFGDSPNPKLDPDWMSKRPQRTATRQYARLTSDASSDPSLEVSSGALSIPTPVITRIRSAGPIESLSPLHPKPESTSNRDIFTEKFISQTDELNFRSQKLVQGTLDLIEATNTCSSPDAQEAFFPANGSRSLRAMCCRRYARHVVQLENEQESQGAEERFDVATEAYTLLDEIFDIGGSDYLRAIAREHGMALFENMVLSSRIPRTHVLALVRRMRNPQRSRAKHSSNAEIEAFSDILLRSLTPDKPCCGRDNTYAHTFNTIAEISSQCDARDRTASQFRRFEILAKFTLPVCWFGSRRLTGLWTSVFRAFMDPGRSREEKLSSVRDASSFLETVLSLDCGLIEPSTITKRLLISSAIPDYYGNALGCPKCPKVSAHARFMSVPSNQQPHAATSNHASRKRLFSALNNSISSTFAILASFVISSTMYPERFLTAEPVPIKRLLFSLSMNILLNPIQLDASHDESVLERCTAILAATLIVGIMEQPNSDEAPICISDLIEGLEAIDQQARRRSDSGRSTLELLPDLVFSMVRSSAKLLGSDGFEVLSHLATALTSSSRQENLGSSTYLFLAELAVSSTHLFAERSGLAKASKLAATLETSLHSHKFYSARETPFKATPRPKRDREGLRWEDGIGEWIEGAPTQADPIQVGNRVSFRLPTIRPTSCGLSAREVQHGEHDGRSFVYSDDLSSDDDAELGYQQLPHISSKSDAGLSLLLLSPDTVTASSPASIPPICSTMRSKDLQTRSPLTELTNTNDMHPYPMKDRQKGEGKGRKYTSAKRTFVESMDETSDDEISILQPLKRHQPHATRRTLDSRGSSEENTGVVNSDSEDSLTISSSIEQKSRKVSRRNPRGKILRSLYTNSRDYLSYRASSSNDMDDELGCG